MGYVIACPLGYYIMNKWLENFAYRIVIGPMAFVEAGVGVLVITMSAVIYKSWRAATVNPSEALRYE
jgi:putative ABC transport system permease protein